jgi:DNA-binding transcriptional LysR family regulator
MLMSHAHCAIQLSEEALGRLRGVSVRKQVSLGTSADVALAGLVPALKRPHSIHLDLELKVVVTAAGRLDALLKNRQLDLVIAGPRLMTVQPSITWLVPLQWTAHRDLQFGKSQLLPLILFENPCAWQDAMLDSLRKSGWEWRVSFPSASLDAIIAAARSGLGIAALPSETMRNSKLMSVQMAGLPPAPELEFGLFPAIGLALRHARSSRSRWRRSHRTPTARISKLEPLLCFHLHTEQPQPRLGALLGDRDSHRSEAVAETTPLSF